MKSLITILIIAAALVGGYFLFKGEPASAPSVESPAVETEMPVPGETAGAPEKTVVTVAAEISFTASGFSPAGVTIKQGETVNFKNESSKNMWPASAFHPTHSVYPESGGCLGSTFDACRGVPPGENWSFKFDHTGTWKFHDHLAPQYTGSVTVE